MNSIQAHGLSMSRAVFVNGGNPFRYMNALNASLFLSANPQDVRKAVDQGLPAGRVFPTTFADEEDDLELRLAFDFDGVVADDSAEAVFQKNGLKAFHESETQFASEPLQLGPLGKFSPKSPGCSVSSESGENRLFTTLSTGVRGSQSRRNPMKSGYFVLCHARQGRSVGGRLRGPSFWVGGLLGGRHARGPYPRGGPASRVPVTFPTSPV